MSISDIIKSSGAGSVEAPGVSFSTLNYSGPAQTAGDESAAYMLSGDVERPNNPFTVAVGTDIPDDGNVTWYLDGISQATLDYTAAFTPTQPGVLSASFVLGGTTYTTVPLPLLMAHMGMMAGHSPSHMVDENAALALVRHDAATAIAVQSGNWSDPSTWNTGTLPDEASRVLIPLGIEVLYDAHISPRLDVLRIDGALIWALDKSTKLLVETMVETPSGRMEIGSAAAGALPEQFIAEIIISNRNVSLSLSEPTDLDFANDPRLLGRGLLWMGETTAYGHHRAPVYRTAAGQLPRAGDVTIALVVAPGSWRIGDQIIVPGTVFDLDNAVSLRQDEQRTITDIQGAVVTLNAPLVYDHDHRNDALAADAIWTLPIANTQRNILIRSENHEAIETWQRGHTMFMHDRAKVTFWDVGCLGLGRTNKAEVSGVLNDDGLFELPDRNANNLLTAPMSAQSNIQSRYPLHGHFLGFAKTEVPEIRYCYIEDAKAWSMVHHGCRMNLIGNVGYRFQGAFMVAETGDELGRWHDNYALGVDTIVGSTSYPKTSEGAIGIEGDFARQGYGFFYRGRDMVVTDCVATGCAWAHVFYHRSNTATVAAPIDPLRVNMDSHDLAWLSRDQNNSIAFVHRPITHFDGCEAIGCYGGVAVVKSGPAQLHDLNIQVANFKGWGLWWGIGVNYIGGYQLENIDVASSAYVGSTPTPSFQNNGIETGKSLQVAVNGVITRGFTAGVRFAADGVNGVGNSAFSQADPRYMLKNHTSIGDTLAVEYEGIDDGTPTSSVTWLAPGGHTEVDYPSLDGPLVVASWSGNNVLSNLQQPFNKTDSVSSAGALPKSWDIAGVFDAGTPRNTAIRLRVIRDSYGYYMYNGTPHIAAPIYISDRLTARSSKVTRLVEYTGSTSGLTNLGTFSYSATPITATDFTVNVVQGQTVTFNALTLSGAAGEVGATLTLGDPHMTAFINTGDALADPTPYEPAHFKPNRGDITIAQDGAISYTALPHDQPATDDMQVYVYDGRGRWQTVTITFSITMS